MDLPKNLQQLSYDELVELNRAIVAQLKERNALKAQLAMRQFQLGNTVEFWSSEGERIQGTVCKRNKKTVSIITQEGRQWNVSPSLLQKTSANIRSAQDQEVIDFTDEPEA
jgi:hypothetical protein